MLRGCGRTWSLSKLWQFHFPFPCPGTLWGAGAAACIVLPGCFSFTPQMPLLITLWEGTGSPCSPALSSSWQPPQSHARMAALQLSRTLSVVIDYSNSSPPFQGLPWVVMFSCLAIAIAKWGNSVCTACLSPLFWLWLTTSEKLAKWDVVEKILAERRKGKRMGKAGMEIRVLGIEQVWHVGYNQLAWLALTGILTATRQWVWEEEQIIEKTSRILGPNPNLNMNNPRV